jgi:glycosyltransferase involved in cell wall biosynthesis
MPKVSIIIPCYNQGHYIREALDSVKAIADKSLYEVIITDDGSTDANTLKVFTELEKEGYNVIHQKNMGLGAARNNAIKVARGEYILPLDSDNRITAEYITEAVKILDADKSIDVVYSDATYFGDKQGTYVMGDFNLQRLMIENFIDACSVYRKSKWEEVGGYDEKMPVMGYEDWDMWLRFAFSKGKFKYIPKPLYYYRSTGNSMIRTIEKEKYDATMQYVQEKYKGYLGRNYLNQLIYFKASKNKGLAFYILLRAVFPRLHNLLNKAGIVKRKDII